MKVIESQAKSTSILKRYNSVRQTSEFLCNTLDKEDYVAQPVVDVSPPKWHLAHTTWFFETFLLEKFYRNYQRYHNEYGYIFNSYYEAAGDRVLRADRGNLTRPSVEDVYGYRTHVDQFMSELLTHDISQSRKFRQVLEIGLQHEQQHQELLLTDIKYILGHNPLFPNYYREDRTQTGVKNKVARFLEIPEGLYPVGHQGDGFCFDNELGGHQVYLQAFRIMDRLVTNMEYLKFIADGGYEDFRFWLMEGWEWVKSAGIQAPLYWHHSKGEWLNYTLNGLEPVDWEAPVTHISFYEADAFANWKGMRLPTEFEWETACKSFQPQIPDSAHFQETGRYLPTVPLEGNLQFFGDAWEWTASSYRPYPYFKQEEGALGEYNGKFMVNQMVLKGGSCATPRSHIRASYRNFFHPHLRWQFTGIRLASHI